MAKKYNFRKTFTHDGIRYEIRADSQQELYMKLANKLRDLEEGRIIIDSSMTVRQWGDMAMETYKPNLSDYGKRDMKYRVNKHIYSRIGGMKLKQIKPLQCQDIMNSQADYSFSHVQKVYQDLHFIFQKAVENHLIPENPAAHITKPAAVKGSRRSITEVERAHFLKVAERVPEFILFEFMLYCGCRPGEAINLIKKDIETVDGERMLHIRGTKTENSDRYVPIPDILYDKVKKYTPFEFLCRNGANNKHSEASYNRLSSRLRREMNIEMGCKTYRNALVPPYPLAPDFVPYNFRHTYCTDLARAGVDIRTAQKLMGHADISITANIYTHVDTNDIIKAAKQIEEYRKAL